MRLQCMKENILYYIVIIGNVRSYRFNLFFAHHYFKEWLWLARCRSIEFILSTYVCKGRYSNDIRALSSE